MQRHKKRSSSVLRPEDLEGRLLLSGDLPGPRLDTGTPVELGRGRDEMPGYMPDHIIVRYRDDMSAMSGPHPSGLVPGRSLSGAEGLRIVGIGPASDVPSALEAARRDPRVLYAEPDYLIRAETIPNDPRFGELWGLRNVGQGSGTAGADIDATVAWQGSTGASDVVVAVLDSGVDFNHPDLAANIWTNPGEIAGNGIDDDGNGYVDDVRGWDFVNRDAGPMDDNSHGTHVAGTIGAVGNNQVGVSGVAWDVSIMPLKVLDRYGNGTVSAAIDAITYAWRNGAEISNASWGGTSYSQALRDAIRVAGESADHLFVAAAGNNGTIMDLDGAMKFYPASFDLPNIVSVAASDRNDQLAGFSNSGWISVDLAAPGVDILSTVPGGGYGSKSGTSMAAPHVSGAAALLRAMDPTLGAAALKGALMGSVDPTGPLTVSGGRLNVARAAQEVSPDPGLRSGVVELSGPGEWTRVTLDRLYTSMVVAATPEIAEGGASLVPRIRNVDRDGFEISVTPAVAAQDASLQLGGFESPEAGPGGSWGSFRYRPTGTAWAYSGNAGVAANRSGFTRSNPDAPQGDQVAFLQGGGVLSQAVQVADPGTYRLSFKAAQRGNSPAGGGHDFALRVGGAEVARFTPQGTSYAAHSATFQLPAGAHEIALAGLNSLGGDRASLLDDLRLERVGDQNFGSNAGPIRVHYLVAEEGTYTEQEGGVSMEARKVTVDSADRGGPDPIFRGTPQQYAQPYAMPVVIGQVMTSNDPRPSMFWASGGVRTEAPSPTSLTVGMHVGEDPTTTRQAETVGYFVFEAGAHHVDGVDLVAGRTGPSVRGMDESMFIAPISGLSGATSAVLSQSTMIAPEGSWAAFRGADPVRPDSLQMTSVEDQWGDAERSHAGEAVSYVVFGQASGFSSNSFSGRPATPGLSSIEPRITITRTSGTEPFVVQVSAAETLINSGDAFTDLEYSWDFGDSIGQEYLVHPVSGVMVNANSSQEGPEAAYVYRHPGTYSITLTVRGKDEAGDLITATTSTLMRAAAHEVKVVGASGGSFRLTASVDGGPGHSTAPIPFNAKPDEVVAALAALPNIGTGNLRTGAHLGPELVGSLLGRGLSLSADSSGLIGASVEPVVRIFNRSAGSLADEVIVSAWSGPEIYFDTRYDGTSNGTPNGSEAAPFNTFSRLKSVLNSGASQHVLIKRGSVFAGDSGITITEHGSGPLRISSYGDPALPKPIISTSSASIWIKGWTNRRTEDIVIDGLDLRSSGNRALFISHELGSGPERHQINNVHVLETDFYGGQLTSSFIPLVQVRANEPIPGSHLRGEAFVFWNNTYDREGLLGSASYQVGLDLDVTDWVSVVGGTMTGGGAGPNVLPYFSHHVYANVYDHLLFRWMRFEEGDKTLNFAIKLRQVAGSPGQIQSRTLIDGSDFGGAANGIGPTQEHEGRPFGTLLVQDSAFHVGPQGHFQAMGMYVDNLRRLVVRDSDFFRNGRGGVHIASVDGMSLGFYRNKVFIPAMDGNANGLNTNSRMASAEVLDNIFVLEGTAAASNVAIRTLAGPTAGWRIDRNQHWAPNAGGRVALVEMISLAMRDWQARGWDLNGSYGDPGWIDPANGDFRRRR